MTTSTRPCTLETGVAATIRRHGEETFPHECCGALIGTGERVVAAVPLPNTTEEGPRRRFLVRPSDYRMAEQRATELGGELLGFYHSHPDHPARPSQFDLDHAWPNFAYVIVSVMSGVARDLTVWFLQDDRSRFDEGTLNGDEDSDSDTAPTVHG
jgi:proteasome lid subunit RPN8/RPN11